MTQKEKRPAGEYAAEARRRYSQGLLQHLSSPSERTRVVAYEFGRDAVQRGSSLAELALLHHECVSELRDANALEASFLASGAGEFLAEALAPFEMVHRGYRESLERLAAVNRDLEQRAQELEAANATIRRLAREQQSFLAEASRALSATLSVNGTAEAAAAQAVQRLADWAGVVLLEQERVRLAALACREPSGLEPLRSKLEQALPGWSEADPGASRIRAGVVVAEEWQRALETPGVQPFVLRTGPRVRGVLLLGGAVESSDRQLMAEYAARAAIALENAAMFEDAQAAVRIRDQFLAIASHELRTPLTPLQLSLERLRRDLAADGDGAKEQLAQRGLRQIERLRALIEELLDATRIGSGELQLQSARFDLAAALGELVQLFEQTDGAHSFSFSAPAEEAICVEGDRFRIEQVVSNLLENAAKYSPAGSGIRVELERSGSEAVVSVTDSGIGIPEGERERVFELYFRAANASARHYGGLGIGLHICRELIHRHGGRIWMEPGQGGGSSFRFSLPCCRFDAT